MYHECQTWSKPNPKQFSLLPPMSTWATLDASHAVPRVVRHRLSEGRVRACKPCRTPAVESLPLVGLPESGSDPLVYRAWHGVPSRLPLVRLVPAPYTIPRRTWCPDLTQNVMSGNSSASRR